MRQVLARPSPFKKEKSIKKIKIFIFIFVFLTILFVGLGFLSHLPKIVLNNIETIGLKVINAEELEDKTLNYLSYNTALLYSKGNIFLYSEKGITEFIKKEFPRVYSVDDINREKQTLYISLEERQSAYLWCGFDEPSYDKQYLEKDCYFIDQTGFIFDKAPFFTNGVYFTFYGGVNEDSSPVGQTVVLQNSMLDLMKVVNLLKEKDIKVHSVVLKKDGQNFFLIDNKTSFGGFSKIFFNEDESIDILLEKINISLSEESFVSDFKLKSADLEYIDTRFKNRVFYKFVNE